LRFGDEPHLEAKNAYQQIAIRFEAAHACLLREYQPNRKRSSLHRKSQDGLPLTSIFELIYRAIAACSIDILVAKKQTSTWS